MHARQFAQLFLVPFFIGVFAYTSAHILHAQTADSANDTGNLKEQVDQLDQDIKARRSRVKELQGLIGKYKDRIDAQELKQTSLENEVLLLDNRVTSKQLSIEETKMELDALRLEIQQLEKSIAEQTSRINKQKDFVSELVRRINRDDRIPAYEILLTKPNLSSFFDQLENTKRLGRDLTTALEKVKTTRLTLEINKQERDTKSKDLEAQKKKLKKEELALEAERNFKLSLAHETKNKQEEFQRVLYELQQQQQGTASDISSLEIKLKDKLNSIDDALAHGDALLSWPVDPSRGITAKFHDPTYPFRNLFQHPGTDVRAYVGTTIKSAAGGYVAWNKQGRLYGNYVMVVHPGNLATVYAHLSKFIAKPDTYIERGDALGLTGGMPGQAGAGLSTGPHLHFEVRQNGIPVDPENFLPSVSSEE